MSYSINKLVAEAKKLPPPTKEEQEEHRLSFAYGNLALTHNHKPSRDRFREIALREGWTEERFDRWASGREWW